MTRKLLTVVVEGTCGGCSYLDQDEGERVCENADTDMLEIAPQGTVLPRIPDWCPLPDAPEPEVK